MKKLVAMLAVAFSVLIAGCQGSSTVGGDAAQDVAEITVQRFMEGLAEKNYEKAFSVVHKEFFATKTQEQWQQYFDHTNSVLGKKTGGRLKNKVNDARLSGVFYMYEYASQFENGLGKEIVTLVQKINTNDPPLVFGYKIESSKLPEAHD